MVKLSIVIPARNEEKRHLAKTLDLYHAFFTKKFNLNDCQVVEFKQLGLFCNTDNLYIYWRRLINKNIKWFTYLH